MYFGESAEVVGTPQILTLAQINAMNTPPGAAAPGSLTTPLSTPVYVTAQMVQPLSTPITLPSQTDPSVAAPVSPAPVSPFTQSLIASSESVPLTSTTDLASRIQDQGLPTPPAYDPTLITTAPVQPKQNVAPLVVGALAFITFS